MVPLQQCTIAIDDPAVQAGLGLFETIALRAGQPLDLEPHVERLVRAAAVLDVALPPRPELKSMVLQTAAAQPAPFGWLKIVATRGGRCVAFTGEMDPQEAGCSVTAVLLPWRRNVHDAVCGLKTLNYAASVLGAEEARRRGADEGIWLNTRGHLAEGSTSNLFVVNRRKLFTPGTRDGILAGVVRDLTLRAARGLSLPVYEGKVRLRRLERADEAFLTSSLRGIRPLIEFQGRPVGDGKPGRITRALAEAVERLRAKSLQRLNR